ncbi:Ankyrin repeat-containing protein ITN1 [Bienertia sinuspersici]
MMTKEIYRMAESGDYLNLKQHMNKIGRHFFQSHDFQGKNLIHKFFLIKTGHVIISVDFLHFIRNFVNKFQHLFSETDKNGDTPIHILARLNPNNIMIHLAIGDPQPDNPTPTENLYPGPKPNDPNFFNSSYQEYTYVWENLGRTNLLSQLIEHIFSEDFDWKCLTQNIKGNTPLHEAILANNYPVFLRLTEFHKGATTLVNKHNETVLHLLAKSPMPSLGDDVLGDIINNNMKHECHMLDEDGLTPLMRAIQAGNIEFAERLCSLCPRLAELSNLNGQTFWHLLVDAPPIESFYFANSSFTKEVVRHQLDTKDKDGKTALHLALEHRRFDLAEAFLGLDGTLTSDGTPFFLEHLLKIPNNNGITPAELIGELSYVPLQFEEFIGKLSTMIGIRSIWGIPSTQIKDYVNTMGVIAALLTTITFTAAFTVPGGLDQEKGTPLLIQDASFQIFIISDILAMCLSMMVLFCLLWIMATGNKSNSVVLLDFSVILLLLSFYTTLVTFMTGLYATTYLAKPWIAIFALVICSVLLVLMHKYLVMKFIIPSGKVVLIFFDKAFLNARKFSKKLLR